MCNYLVEIDIDFFEYFVKNGYEMTDIFNRKDHRRLQFQNVVIRSVATDDDLLVLHPGYNVLRLRRRRYPLNSVAD